VEKCNNSNPKPAGLRGVSAVVSGAVVVDDCLARAILLSAVQSAAKMPENGGSWQIYEKYQIAE